MPLLPRRTNLRLLAGRPGALLWRYRWAALLLFVGAMADGMTTFRSLREFGADAELHPAQRVVCELLGVAIGVPVAKAVQVVFVVLLACWWRPWCGWLMGGCGVLYCAATVVNHYHLL